MLGTKDESTALIVLLWSPLGSKSRLMETVIQYAMAAFLGGVFLNVMPCVLPVLTMKVFHLIESGQEDAAVQCALSLHRQSPLRPANHEQP